MQSTVKPLAKPALSNARIYFMLAGCT